MRLREKWYHVISVVLIIALIAGSASLASYASSWGQWDDLDFEELVDDIHVQEAPPVQAYAGKLSGRTEKTATSSDALATPSVLYDQNDAREVSVVNIKGVTVETNIDTTIADISFKLYIGDDCIYNTNDASALMQDGYVLATNSNLSIDFSLSCSPVSLRNSEWIRWNIGKFEGITLESSLSPYYVTYLQGTDGSKLGEFYLEVDADGAINILFVSLIDDYDIAGFGTNGGKVPICGFKPVETETKLWFYFPTESGEEGRYAILRPNRKPEPSTPEETTEGTTEATTEASTAESTPDSGNNSAGGGGDSSDDSPASRPSQPATSPEETQEASEEAASEESIPPEQPAKQPLEKPAEKPAEQEAANGDDDDSDDDENDVVQVEGSFTENAVQGELITGQVLVENKGNTTARNVRVRIYLPDHTTYRTASSGGTWQVFDGKERVSWKIDSLAPGESVTLSVGAQVFICVPLNYQLQPAYAWQVNDTLDINSIKEPENRMEMSPVTVQK